MRCPFCHKPDTNVRDSRASEDNSTIRRRRICTKCNFRFTTFERIKLTEMIVLKKNASTETFSRQKLMQSILIAIRKRPISAKQVEELVNNVIQKIENVKDNKVSTSLIGKIVIEYLRKLDIVAYIRFASVYMNFDGINDFSGIIDKLSQDEKN